MHTHLRPPWPPGSPTRRRLAHLVLAASALGAGCGVAAPASNPFDDGVPMGRAIILRAENQALAQATVSFWLSGQRQNLGRVESGTVEFFTIRAGIRDHISIEVELAGGRRHRFEPIPANPGQQLQLYISNDVTRSVLRE